MSILVYTAETGFLFKDISPYWAGKTLDDISRQLPQGVYTTFRTFGGSQKVIGLQEHLNRLYHPAEAAGIRPSVSAIELRLGLSELLKAYSPKEVRVRICLSFAKQPGQVFIMIELLRVPDEILYDQGVKVVSTMIERNEPRIKSTAFILASNSERKALINNEIYEALMVRDGTILEGLTSNFYAFRNPKIITARNGILLGVTRKVILRLLRMNNVPIEYRALRIDELSQINEAFISSSSRGVLAVVNIDGVTIGEGKPGYISRMLRTAYDEYVIKKADII